MKHNYQSLHENRIFMGGAAGVLLALVISDDLKKLRRQQSLFVPKSISSPFKRKLYVSFLLSKRCKKRNANAFLFYLILLINQGISERNNCSITSTASSTDCALTTDLFMEMYEAEV
jgi:hypothetical protein